MPSRPVGCEAFGSALLEAMAQGAVPVVTEVGGMPWVVGTTGVTVVLDDTSALVDGIKVALETEPGSGMQQRVRERFSADRRRASLASALRIGSIN